MFATLRSVVTPARLVVGAFVCLTTVAVFRTAPGVEARAEEWENLTNEVGERMEKAKDNTKEAVERVENVTDEVKEAVEIDGSEVAARAVRGTARAIRRENRRERWEN
jgi:ABC-type nitrate/sulfonate/bicarbonate transport system substrate-binding protein